MTRNSTVPVIDSPNAAPIQPGACGLRECHAVPTRWVLPYRAMKEGQAVDFQGHQRTQLSRETTQGLRRIAEEHGLTLNTIALGVWALLLSRYSGEEEVVFGAVRVSREPGSPGSTPGVVLMRILIQPDSEVIPWLTSLRQMELTRFEDGSNAFESVAGAGGALPGETSFESFYCYHPETAAETSPSTPSCGTAGSAGAAVISTEPGCPLVIEVSAGESLQVDLAFYRPRFEEDAVARMLGHVRTLLEGFAANPQGRVLDLPMLTESERRHLLGSWSGGQTGHPEELCLHERFEAQVRRTPRALAVTAGDQTLDYRSLNRWAERVARALQEEGVGPDDCVGICLDRSMESLVAYLAVWKTGGVCVPIDPACAITHRDFMLRDTKAAVLLTLQSLLDWLQLSHPGLKRVCVDAPDIPPRAARAIRRVSFFQPRSLAAVLYSEGSAGQPIGVEFEHSSLANLVSWHQRSYQVRATDRAALLAAPASAVALWEAWPYLCAGASVHLPGEDALWPPRNLVAWLVSKKIALAWASTTLADLLLDESWPKGCGLRAILTGGGRLRRTPSKIFPCVLVNHYGPPEYLGAATWMPVNTGLPGPGLPPIGRPVANTQVLILDCNLQPVPVGVPGDLYVTGASLARGYHNRPGLTATRFIPHPFWLSGSRRLFATRQQARWQPDGNIEFLGSEDRRITWRGHCLDLDELEAVLRQCPAVHHCAAFLGPDPAGELQLAVCVVPAPDHAPPTAAGLRRFLQTFFPEFMLPKAWYFVDSLTLGDVAEPHPFSGMEPWLAGAAPAGLETGAVVPSRDKPPQKRPRHGRQVQPVEPAIH